MLTITRIVVYPKKQAPAKPKRTRVAKPPGAPPGKSEHAKKNDVDRRREQRAKAREEGKCGICTFRWPRPGLKTCEHCQNLATARRRRNSRLN